MGRARVMARQLTEQLEREVNAEELLKQQIDRERRGPTAGAVPPPWAEHPLPPDAPAAAGAPSRRG